MDVVSVGFTLCCRVFCCQGRISWWTMLRWCRTFATWTQDQTNWTAGPLFLLAQNSTEDLSATNSKWRSVQLISDDTSSFSFASLNCGCCCLQMLFSDSNAYSTFHTLLGLCHPDIYLYLNYFWTINTGLYLGASENGSELAIVLRFRLKWVTFTMLGQMPRTRRTSTRSMKYRKRFHTPWDLPMSTGRIQTHRQVKNVDRTELLNGWRFWKCSRYLTFAGELWWIWFKSFTVDSSQRETYCPLTTGLCFAQHDKQLSNSDPAHVKIYQNIPSLSQLNRGFAFKTDVLSFSEFSIWIYCSLFIYFLNEFDYINVFLFSSNFFSHWNCHHVRSLHWLCCASCHSWSGAHTQYAATHPWRQRGGEAGDGVGQLGPDDNC